MAGGLWIAKALQEKYAATREAFAAGRLRSSQVRVIVQAADRAPAGVTADQLREAEESLVAMATGDGSRSGRPMNAKRLRQAARRMFETTARRSPTATSPTCRSARKRKLRPTPG